MMDVCGQNIQHILAFIMMSVPLTRGSCDVADNPSCKDGANKYNALSDFCFKSEKTGKSWQDAVAFCGQFSMDLVVAENYVESEMIGAVARQEGLDTYWIGVTYDETRTKPREQVVTVPRGIPIREGLGDNFVTAQFAQQDECVWGNSTAGVWYTVTCEGATKQVLCMTQSLDNPDKPDLLGSSHNLADLEPGGKIEVTCGANLRKNGKIKLATRTDSTRSIQMPTEISKNETFILDSDGTCIRRVVLTVSFTVEDYMHGARLACYTHDKHSGTECGPFAVYCTFAGHMVITDVKPDTPKLEVIRGNLELTHLIKGSNLVVKCSAHLRTEDEIKFALMTTKETEIIGADDTRFEYEENPTTDDNVNAACSRLGIAQLTLALTPDMEDKRVACLSHYNESKDFCYDQDRACRVYGRIRYAPEPVNKDKCGSKQFKSCDDGSAKYPFLSDSCFKSDESPKTFEEAKKFCKESNMFLVLPESRDEARALHEMAKIHQLRSYWIGQEKRSVVAAARESSNKTTSKRDVEPREMAVAPKGPKFKMCTMVIAIGREPLPNMVDCSERYPALCQELGYMLKEPDHLSFNYDLSNLEDGAILEFTCAANVTKNGGLNMFREYDGKHASYVKKESEKEEFILRPDGVCIKRITADFQLPLTRDMDGNVMACKSSEAAFTGKCTESDPHCTRSDPLKVGDLMPDRPRIDVLTENPTFTRLEKGTDLVLMCAAHLRTEDNLRFVLTSDDKNIVFESDDERLQYNESATVEEGVNPMCDRHGKAQLTLTLTAEMEGMTLLCVSNYDKDKTTLCAKDNIGCRVFGTIGYNPGILKFGMPPWIPLVVLAVLLIALLAFACLLRHLQKGDDRLSENRRRSRAPGDSITAEPTTEET